MQYQHLVFEEFARKVQPNVDPFVFNNIHGHRPLDLRRVRAHGLPLRPLDADRTRSRRTDAERHPTQHRPVRGLPEPAGFNASGADADEAAGAIIRGMTREVGNEIDEFVVNALRNQLVGLPLDLAALNIARGRDTGIPSLNEAAAQLYERPAHAS